MASLSANPATQERRNRLIDQLSLGNPTPSDHVTRIVISGTEQSISPPHPPGSSIGKDIGRFYPLTPIQLYDPPLDSPRGFADKSEAGEGGVDYLEAFFSEENSPIEGPSPKLPAPIIEALINSRHFVSSYPDFINPRPGVREIIAAEPFVCSLVTFNAVRCIFEVEKACEGRALLEAMTTRRFHEVCNFINPVNTII